MFTKDWRLVGRDEQLWKNIVINHLQLIDGHAIKWKDLLCCSWFEFYAKYNTQSMFANADSLMISRNNNKTEISGSKRFTTRKFTQGMQFQMTTNLIIHQLLFENKFELLKDILNTSSMAELNGLCHAVADVLMAGQNMFGLSELTLYFTKQQLDAQVQPLLLFRANTPAVCLWTSFAKLSSSPFLLKFVIPFVGHIIENDINWEVTSQLAMFTFPVGSKQKYFCDTTNCSCHC